MSQTPVGPWYNRKDVYALTLLLLLSVLLRVLDTFQVGFLVLPAFVIASLVLPFWSPPVIASFLLFGWVLFPLMESLPFGPFPRIPATSIMGLTVLAGLAAARLRTGSLSKLVRPAVLLYVGLFLMIFGLGYLGIFLNGKWSNLMVRTLAWQKLISCASMFFCGILCCRGRRDFWLIVHLIPIWFVLYLIYIPMATYLDFPTMALTGASSYGVGLAYKLLNTNMLGQGACLTAVVGYILWARPGTRIWHRSLYGGLFVLASATTIATASRQSLLALTVGLWLAFTRARPMLGCALAVVTVAAFSAMTLGLTEASPEYGLLARFADLGKPSEEWSTGSVSARSLEIELALEYLWESPIIGFGFGGYGLTKKLPDIDSTGELNDSDALNQLWNDGYFLVGEHNFPIALYMQTGLVGVVSFLALSIGPYLRLRRQNRLISPLDQDVGRTMDLTVSSLWVTIFVLQSISGGFTLGSMSTLLFLTGALAAGFAEPLQAGRRTPHGNQKTGPEAEARVPPDDGPGPASAAVN